MRLNRVRGAVLLSAVVISCAGSVDGGAGEIGAPEDTASGGSSGAPVGSAGAGGTVTGSSGATSGAGGSSVSGGSGGGGTGGLAPRDSGAEAACASTCSQAGAQQCADPTSYQRCAATVGSCLTWSAATACPAGQVCSAGQCGAAKTCKRGVAYNFDNASVAADMPALKSVSWFYNWTATVSSQVGTAMGPAAMEFVPMVWGRNINVDDIVNRMPGGAKYLLGFNEPNFGNQSNLTPAQAAQLWPQIEQIAQRKNLKIVSPAVNFCGSPCNVQDPVAWMDQFFAACTNCKVDHIAIHWYACTGQALQTYVTSFKKYNKPLWVTEFACADQGTQSADVQRAYLRDAIAYMEAEPAIFRYSWFSGRTTNIANVNLLAGAGQLTALGQDYQSLAPGVSCQR